MRIIYEQLTNVFTKSSRKFTHKIIDKKQYNKAECKDEVST